MSRSIPLSRQPARSSDKGTGDGSPADRQCTLHARADYIQDMTDELRRMADEAGFDLLAYILDMAYIEAGHVRKRTGSVLEPPAAACTRDDQ